MISKRIKRSLIILLFLLFSFSCAYKKNYHFQRICHDLIFPESYVFLIKGAFFDGKEKQRFEAVVYSKDTRVRMEILNTLGFAEIIIIYDKDIIHVENRRENSTDIYRKGIDKYYLFDTDIFAMHPGFLFTGYDYYLKDSYPARFLFEDFARKNICISVFNNNGNGYIIKRKTDTDELVFSASNPEKIGDCLFFRSRSVIFKNGRLEYDIESYSINLELKEELFIWK